MPAFDLLPKDEVAALVEYVKYLSMRGQTEYRHGRRHQRSERGRNACNSTIRRWSTTILAADRRKMAAAPTRAIIQPPEKPDVELAEFDRPRDASCSTAPRPTASSVTAPASWATARRPTTTTGPSRWSNMPRKFTKGCSTIPSDPDMSARGQSRRNQGARSTGDRSGRHHAAAPQHPAPQFADGHLSRRRTAVRFVSANLRPASTACRCRASARHRNDRGSARRPTKSGNLVDYIRSLPYEPMNRPPRPPRSAARGHHKKWHEADRTTNSESTGRDCERFFFALRRRP